MKAYESYVRKLEKFAAEALEGRLASSDRARHLAAVNGEASTTLSRLVPLETRKAAGAFFTGTKLGMHAIAPALRAGTQAPATPVFDPACGAGDLLLSWASHLKVEGSLAETLDEWGRIFSGTDLEPLFVRATRARLVLAAALRADRRGRTKALALSEIFPGIRRADGLESETNKRWKGHLVLNPPFVMAQAPEWCTWSEGLVSTAALFVDYYLKRAAGSARITAILPDVLRTGARYGTWRDEVERQATIHRVEVHGRFDPAVDVDVFFLDLTARSEEGSMHASTVPSAEESRVASPRIEWWRLPKAGGALGDVFAVSVGAVVPHRHKDAGRAVAYLHSEDAPHWGVVKRIPARRGFTGRLEKPPFVVVRRTSGPRDSFRAIGTVVLGRREVAVENHLLVLCPLDGQEATCHAALTILKSKETNEWLNERIRCRHLTVAALREVPWRINQI